MPDKKDMIPDQQWKEYELSIERACVEELNRYRTEILMLEESYNRQLDAYNALPFWKRLTAPRPFDLRALVLPPYPYKPTVRGFNRWLESNKTYVC